MGPWIRLGTLLGDIYTITNEKDQGPKKIKIINDIEIDSH